MKIGYKINRPGEMRCDENLTVLNTFLNRSDSWRELNIIENEFIINFFNLEWSFVVIIQLHFEGLNYSLPKNEQRSKA